MNNVPGMRAPSVRSASNRSRVNVAGMAGAVWWPLFDSQILPAAGATSMKFFAVPIGQAGKTATDTNMELAGQIPAGQRFIITGAAVHLYPDIPVVQETVDELGQQANIVYDILKGGRLTLQIGSKNYIDHGPLMRFPPQNHLEVNAAMSLTTAAAEAIGSSVYAAAKGPTFPTFDSELVANQNFSVTLHDLAANTSDTEVRVVVDLLGWLYRNAQ